MTKCAKDIWVDKTKQKIYYNRRHKATYFRGISRKNLSHFKRVLKGIGQIRSRKPKHLKQGSLEIWRSGKPNSLKDSSKWRGHASTPFPLEVGGSCVNPFPAWGKGVGCQPWWRGHAPTSFPSRLLKMLKAHFVNCIIKYIVLLLLGIKTHFNIIKRLLFYHWWLHSSNLGY